MTTVTPPTSLTQAAMAVLTTADPQEKCRLTHAFARQWQAGQLSMAPDFRLPPDRPARPERPALLPPRDMPRRAYGGDRGRIGLLHALAHIELNAIDLAWDIVCRFPNEVMPRVFLDDWVQVAEDEAKHFEMLADVLASLGAAYGDLPAHDGLWQAAEKTADDLMARLAVVPMTLEARGLDTTPATMAKLSRNGDTLTPPVLDVIFHDEIRHVASGVRWFRHLADKRGIDPAASYARWIGERFPGGLKAPFNHAARAEAGFPPEWYTPLAAASA